MAEYVTKEQVIDWYRPYGHTDEPIPFETLVSDLRDMKAADVAPVRHWRWLGWGKSGTPTYENYGTCSVCGEDAEIYTEHRNYCPNCGAKMDGDG